MPKPVNYSVKLYNVINCKLGRCILMKKDRWGIFICIVIILEIIDVFYSLIFKQSIEWFSLIILTLLLFFIFTSYKTGK